MEGREGGMGMEEEEKDEEDEEGCAFAMGTASARAAERSNAAAPDLPDAKRSSELLIRRESGYVRLAPLQARSEVQAATLAAAAAMAASGGGAAAAPNGAGAAACFGVAVPLSSPALDHAVLAHDWVSKAVLMFFIHAVM